MSDLREIGQRGAARITELVGPYLQKVPAEHRGLLIALLERNAARRYRTWAAEASDADERDGLEACASREEEVAERAEGLVSGATRIQESISKDLPDLTSTYDSAFGELSRSEQMAVQAAAERTGAAIWRTLAAGESDATAARVLEECARLEEVSAGFLEKGIGIQTS